MAQGWASTGPGWASITAGWVSLLQGELPYPKGEPPQLMGELSLGHHGHIQGTQLLVYVHDVQDPAGPWAVEAVHLWSDEAYPGAGEKRRIILGRRCWDWSHRGSDWIIDVQTGAIEAHPALRSHWGTTWSYGDSLPRSHGASCCKNSMPPHVYIQLYVSELSTAPTFFPEFRGSKN